MEAFLGSALAVAIAEIGDKTQLLSLFLAGRFAGRHWPIIAGILLATLLNHGVSAWLGAFMVQWVPAGWVSWLIGGSFILIGLWLLIPDSEDDNPSPLERYGPFLATTLLFFLAEIGDKTQVATVVLAAHYQELWPVITGTTLGMLAANVPVVFAGAWLMQRLPMQAARWGACVLFMGLGGLALVGF